MRQPVNPTIFRVVGILMILIGVLNVAPTLAIFTPRGSLADQQEVIGAEADTERAATINTTGTIPTPMGILNLVNGPILAFIGIALLLLKHWEMFAALAIIFDILIKIGTILSQLAVERPLSELLFPLVIIVIEIVMAYVILQQRSARRRMQHEAAQTGEVKRAL